MCQTASFTILKTSRFFMFTWVEEAVLIIESSLDLLSLIFFLKITIGTWQHLVFFFQL